MDPGPRLVQYLAAVGSRLEPVFRPVFFSTRVKSRSLLKRLGQEVQDSQALGRASEGRDAPAIDSERLIARLRKGSDRALVQDSSDRMARLAGDLSTFISVTQPAGVFLWNGSGLMAAMTEQIARALGIPLVVAENGYLPNTLQLDSEGVNAFSSIGRDLDLDRIRALSYTQEQSLTLDRVLSDYRCGRSPERRPPAGGWARPSAWAYLAQALDDWRERGPSIRGNRLIPKAISSLPDAFVFFPLQVRSDSQLTMHSPIYGNRLDAAIADLDHAVRALDSGLRLVVKLHPADLGKTDYDPLVRRFPQIVWIGGGDVREVLARAHCVVTVNSTVGVEGMVFGKPVVTLGDNFYAREGLVHPLRAASDLPTALQRALTEPPDAQTVKQYLRFLYFHAFVPAHWRDFSASSLDNVATRIRTLIGV